MVDKYGQMVQYMKDNGKMINPMVKYYLLSKRVN